jgi:SPX domain protein involved in polyphosphate accumulation
MVLLDEMKNSIRKFYRGLVLLQHYCEMNYTAFHKILKKHDKQIGLDIKKEYMNKIDATKFAQQRELQLVMKETEMVYADCFTEGHRSKAMDELRYNDDIWSNCSIDYRKCGHLFCLTLDLGVF